MLFKLSNLNSNLALTLRYLNPALTQPQPRLSLSHPSLFPQRQEAQNSKQPFFYRLPVLNENPVKYTRTPSLIQHFALISQKHLLQLNQRNRMVGVYSKNPIDWSEFYISSMCIYNTKNLVAKKVKLQKEILSHKTNISSWSKHNIWV